MDGRGIKDLHKCGEEMSKNSSLPSQEQKEQVSWMARAGEREGDKVAKEFCRGWRHQPGQKGGLLSQLVAPTGTKSPCPPVGPASRWTRDKSHLLSRAQRLPGQMAWNKGLFCSSELMKIFRYLHLAYWICCYSPVHFSTSDKQITA